MLRICLIVAIVGGLAAGALSFIKVQDIIVTTRAARDQWHSQFDSEHKSRVTAEASLKKTKADLDTTKKRPGLQRKASSTTPMARWRNWIRKTPI